MKNNVILKEEEGQAAGSDAILKATALLYFKEALLKQEYEDCGELVEIARKFGANTSEIQAVIAAYLPDTAGGPDEAPRGKSRQRY